MTSIRDQPPRRLLASRSHMSEHRPKLGSGNSVRIGGQIISLDAYLAPSKVKENSRDEKPSTQSPQQAAFAPQQPPRKANEKTQFLMGHGEKPRTEQGDKELLLVREQLPIWKHQDVIRDALRKHDVLIITAETGSGKSTQVPQFLFTEDWCCKATVELRSGTRTSSVTVGGAIAITQPRRVAATTLAHRVSVEAGTPLRRADGVHHGLVGYSVRFDHNVPRGTKIKFLTEGMLLQELLRDPHLRQYSAVIIDEIHERSVDVDLLSGFLKQILSGDKAGRGGVPLKVVVMSATANVQTIRSFFTVRCESGTREPAVIEIPGRLYPVDLIHTPKPVPDIQDALLRTIFRIHTEQPCPGDILAFLTGQEEIESAQNILKDYARTLDAKVPKLVFIPLFGQMSIQAQQYAFETAKGRMARKVILATNIAETSVTVPGVRYVVDTGKAKVKQFRVRLGIESLLSKPISKSSAIQRAGRAGREAAGQCYRLYTEEGFQSLETTDSPEILRIDILGAVLTMKARGIDNIYDFPLMDTPKDEAFEKAILHLHVLGALDNQGSITEIGKKMASFPITAPYGRVLLAAADPKYDCLVEVIDILSCLTAGEDIFYQLRSEEEKEEVEEYRKEVYRREGDLLTYLTTVQQYTAENTDRTEWCKRRRINIRVMRQALNIRRQLRGICLKEGLLSETPASDPQPFTPLSQGRAEALIKCFLTGFAMKTAILAPDASYVTAYGKHVVAIHPSSVLHGQKKEAIMFLQHVFTTKNYARKVSVVQSNWIYDVLEG